MVRIKLAFRAVGTTFSPSNAESYAKASFSVKNEPGELGFVGRYQGQPLPYGSGELFDADATPTMSGSPSPFIETLVRLAPACRSAGATSLILHANIAYDSQCNFELSPECISRLAPLGIALTFTCYEDREA